MMKRMIKFTLLTSLIQICLFTPGNAQISASEFCNTVRQKMKEAAIVFKTNASAHGGYVYYYSPDFQERLGEGVTTNHQFQLVERLRGWINERPTQIRTK